MTSLARAGLVAATLLGVAAVQERNIEIYVQNTEEGVEIRAPKSPGKDQMWIAQLKGGFFDFSAVSVKHRVDNFVIDAGARRLGDPMREKWPDKITDLAKNYRDAYLKEKADGKPSDWKECRVVEEDAKAKLPGLPGRGCMHKINLIGQKDEKTEIIQYFVISSEVLYVVTVRYDKDSFQKYWAREGQQILGSIRKCKVEKKKQ